MKTNLLLLDFVAKGKGNLPMPLKIFENIPHISNTSFARSRTNPSLVQQFVEPMMEKKYVK